MIINKTPALIFCSVAAAAIFFLLLTSFEKHEPVGTSVEKETKPDIEWHAPPLPDSISFAGEPVPLDRWEVREELDRQVLFNYYFQNNVLYMMKLSNRYFPMIEERLKAHGIPDDFKYLCVAESNLTQAISKSAAVGFWQFMSYTAPGYNMEITKEIDERYNIRKSTDAACSYIKSAYLKFGSWTAAAASYNSGQGGYNSRATKQGTTYYYDLLLPDETQKYIFRILTFKYLLENTEKLGFRLEPGELYQPLNTTTIIVTETIPDLVAFAKKNNTTYKMLRVLNPWIRAYSLTVKPGKRYQIELPAE